MAGYRDRRVNADASGLRFALIAARFNEEIVAGLVDGARAALGEHGAADTAVDVFHVPGAWELPLAASQLAESGTYDAIVALGCVIRGDTPHFDYVAGECAAGLARVALDEQMPVAFGVLTCDNADQARERAAPGPANKGAEAALAALEMARFGADADAPR